MIVSKIEMDEGSLVFYDEGEEIYNIRQDLLADKLPGGESEWISQLSSKTWMDKSKLAEVVAIIQKEFPKNDIDWDITNKIIARS